MLCEPVGLDQEFGMHEVGHVSALHARRSSASSISTLPVAAGSRNAIRDAAMADPPGFVAQLHALRLQFRHGAVDVFDLEADVEQPGAFLIDPLGDAGIGPLAFQQFDIGLPDRQHRQSRLTDLLFIFQRRVPNVSRISSSDCRIESTAMAMCSTRLIFMAVLLQEIVTPLSTG